MKNLLASVSLGLLFSCLILGCSSDDAKKETAKQEDQNAVERLTDRVADAAVTQIKKPINKAEAVQELMNANSKKIEEAVE